MGVTQNCYTKEVWSAEKQDWCCANKQLGCPPKTKTRRDETPKDETSKDKTPPEDETPEAETPQDETPKSDAAGNNSKAGSCSCMGYNADGSTVPSGECGWASQQQTPGNSCMQVASQAE